MRKLDKAGKKLPRWQIGVIGPSASNLPRDKRRSKRMLEAAEEVGKLLAEARAIVITGGQDGVMEAVCRGAKHSGGVTIGTPGKSRFACNRFVDIEICTPIDVGDYLFAGLLSCDAIIVFPGGAGTLAEVALAYRLNIPMVIFIGFHDWYDGLPGKRLDTSHQKRKFSGASTTKECVRRAFKLACARYCDKKSR